VAALEIGFAASAGVDVEAARGGLQEALELAAEDDAIPIVLEKMR
jgi:hypothetical protein